MYSLLKKILFCFDPETSHHLALNTLRYAYRLGLTRFFTLPPSSPITLMGLSFPNKIGLAAGLDKNGDYIDALAALGFGFIEVGTITPKPQAGNPRPRIFRLTQQEAIINRLGFNNKGVDYLVKRLQQTSFKGILGVNIGKNRDTPLAQAIDDYLYVFRRVAPFASYVTINISSPNTAALRDLQQPHLLSSLLQALKKEQLKNARYVPLVVKISPDLNKEELAEMAKVFLNEKIDGIIATNTTISRTGVEHSTEAGGLSGKPLTTRATCIVKQLYELLQDNIPIMGCGGISSGEDAKEKFRAGASLIQIYTGLIYRGPALLRQLLEETALHAK